MDEHEDKPTTPPNLHLVNCCGSCIYRDGYLEDQPQPDSKAAALVAKYEKKLAQAEQALAEVTAESKADPENPVLWQQMAGFFLFPILISLPAALLHQRAERRYKAYKLLEAEYQGRRNAIVDRHARRG